MRRRLVLVLVFASIVGLIASTLVYRVIAQVAAQGMQEPAEEIVVAAVNMGLAETITPQHVTLVPWPKRSVPAGAIRTLKDADGRVVRGSIVAGEPLLEGKLAPQLAGKGGIMPMLVPEGQRGVTIKVDEATRESGFVLPNSRVDVLVSMAKSPTNQERVAKVILQDVLVLAAGQSVEIRDNKPVTVTTVTLALAPDQAERLMLGQADGKLMLATRNLRDKSVVRTPGVTAATLLGTEAPVAAPKAEGAAAPSPRPRPALVATAPLPAPRLEGHTVAVFRGSKLSEQEFVRMDDKQWMEKREDKK